MKVVAYEPWHFEYCANLSPGGRLLGSETTRLFGIAYQLRGAAYSIATDPGEIVGCAGVIELWPGVGEAWTMFTQTALDKPFFIHRQTKRIIWNIIKGSSLHRCQALVPTGDQVKETWIERLGFTWESNMRKAGPDKSDQGMWVWVKPDDQI